MRPATVTRCPTIGKLEGLGLSWGRSLCVGLILALPFAHLRAQEHESALSDSEVERLRDTAQEPAQRVLAFIGFLDERTKEIQKLSSGPHHPGREDDIHDLMEQFNSVADDFEDNLDDYSARHPDLRKILPKVVAATERWGTILRTPPDHEAYNVSRKLALEAVKDIHDQAQDMMEEQREWFLKHPPGKEPKGSRNDETSSR